MFNRQAIIDLFKRQWYRVERSDIEHILKDTGGISAFECALMYLLILDRAPRFMIEFSPNHGYSTQAMAMAMRVLGVQKRFGTFEIKPNLCKATQSRVNKLGLQNHVDVIQGDALKKIPEWITQRGARIDLVFVDSDHTEGFANRYINELFPLFQPHCLLGVHDICAHKRNDSGQVAFKTSLGKGSKHAGEEKPIERHLKDRKFCVIHGITGGKHEQANLPRNDEFYTEIHSITGVDFRKAKSAPCPKSVWFLNTASKAKAPAAAPVPVFIPSPPAADQHLFIVGMNDSGTTFLQNVLSHCVNCVSFTEKKQRPHGMEGQAVSFWKKKNKNWYPRDIDHGVVKIFSEKSEIWSQPSNKWNWKEIKCAWQEAWNKNAHFKSAKPKVFIEKTPSSLFSLEMYEKQFPGARFLIIHRNPYVVCEGIRRTVKKHKRLDYTLTRCARHWVECTTQQIENIRRLCPGSAMWFKYEDMVTKPEDVAQRIRQFSPSLGDLDLRKPTMCHGMDGNKVQSVVNYNPRQLKALTAAEYAEINTVLEKHMDLMHFFKYIVRTKP